MLISGGVDSAVAMSRLLDQGHDLHLFYIRIGIDTDDGDCSAEEDIEMCTLLAARYGLPFDVVDLHREYWDNVMAYAIEEVKKGLTPNPDIMCNRMIKFGFFEQNWGKEFERTATGHYASIVEKDGEKWLGTAVDPVKDQTDFLARITGSQLDHILFPLGSLSKHEVRRIAEERLFPNASRKDSQGICFLGNINYNDFLRRKLGENPGEIVDIETGKVLGEHKGYWFHTIGQRKGLGLSGGPWYVIDKDIPGNRLFVSRGYDTELQYGHTLHLTGLHWIRRCPFTDSQMERGVELTFKNRHMPTFLKGVFKSDGQGRAVIESEEKVQGIAPGQFVALYDKDSTICYGSGIIWKGKE